MCLTTLATIHTEHSVTLFIWFVTLIKSLVIVLYCYQKGCRLVALGYILHIIILQEAGYNTVLLINN